MIITATITKAQDGTHDYIQLMSDDYITVNIVLVVDKIIIDDHREQEPDAYERRGR